MSLRVFSTFTGIGGFEVGIKNAGATLGVDTELVGYSEIDKHATNVFNYHFKGVKNYGDITKIKEADLPDFDCLVGGFPCQAFSVAGKRLGFDDTRGTLFFDLARILRAKRPRLFVFENVKGLLNHDHGRTFRVIIATITELGYDCQWQVLNSKDFGVPQNRERVIIIGHLRDSPRPKVFPITRSSNQIIKKITGRSQDTRVYDDSGISPTLGTMQGGNKQPKIRVPEATKKGYAEATVGDSINLQQPNSKTRRGRVGKGIANTLDTSMHQYTLSPVETVVDYDRNDGIGKKLEVAHTLSASDYRGLNCNQRQTAIARAVITPDRINKSQNGRRIKDDGEPAFTVTATDRHGVYDGYSIRRLTPLECERLQAFPDNWTKYAELDDGSIDHMSDTQRYKMCGNAVTTNVIEAVFERILIS